MTMNAQLELQTTTPTLWEAVSLTNSGDDPVQTRNLYLSGSQKCDDKGSEMKDEAINIDVRKNLRKQVV